MQYEKRESNREKRTKKNNNNPKESIGRLEGVEKINRGKD